MPNGTNRVCVEWASMPFREFSSYFMSDELNAFTAAYEAAWQHLWATSLTPDQAAALVPEGMPFAPNQLLVSGESPEAGIR